MAKHKQWHELTRRQRREVRKLVRWHLKWQLNVLEVGCDAETLRAALRELKEPK